MSYHEPTLNASVLAVSRKEAARRLGVCLGTIDNMVKRGELRAVRYASRTMIPVSELFRLLGIPEAQQSKHIGSASPASPTAKTAREVWDADHPVSYVEALDHQLD